VYCGRRERRPANRNRESTYPQDPPAFLSLDSGLCRAVLTCQAIIISDLVSLADRGLYQGGVNVLFGAGAALGAVMGGAVADKWGWRMAFWAQIPPISVATVLVVTQVHVPHVKGEMSAWEKFRRIDWAGSAALMICVSGLLRIG
jgi:MFS family permease